MDPLTLSDSTMALLTKSLDLRSTNQQVIAANIANAETPGYAPARFEFEQALQEAVKKSTIALETTQPGHISPQAPSVADVHGRVVREPDSTGIGDQNGVSVDDEMIALSKNQLMYETAAQLLKKKMTMLKYAVSGGQ
ncbi:flagellar basal body rod protein FlgB [Desulfofustis glycolicus]|uniref:Flagellar basal body rod protein FlgB n=1 Tax=Desulfofustis glycolicus DSM 9705 TaxID=1121409 RepID=A0A1M5U262_9BACT|nr:flagellar basal body rod protein FlgB [Desulfofustis glycolicus]MCB2214696.1 flagellar basal body rod protein FlgB [Desulfobulbaceae bacterium]SHH57112.1 flagellar basal-body rod protein FlgB [Desulfofustis glycolicus DSM 9705]